MEVHQFDDGLQVDSPTTAKGQSAPEVNPYYLDPHNLAYSSYQFPPPPRYGYCEKDTGYECADDKIENSPQRVRRRRNIIIIISVIIAVAVIIGGVVGGVLSVEAKDKKRYVSRIAMNKLHQL